MLLATGFADWVAVVLSWVFVASRIVHSYIHTGSNHVPRACGLISRDTSVSWRMWAWFGLRLYVIG